MHGTPVLMTNYYPVLKRAVDQLENSNAVARRTLYEQARTALIEQLSGMQPAVPEAKVTCERLALEEAVLKLEVEAARCLQERLAALAAKAPHKNYDVMLELRDTFDP